MKSWTLTIFALCLFAAPSWATMYQTSFPATEDPLSESGNWINGKEVGINWSDCRSVPGMAFGTEPQTQMYDDSVCALSGNWGPDQTAEATVRVARADSGGNEEVELHLRTTITARSATGYEINCSVKPGSPYLQIVRWNGAYGSWAYVAAAGQGCVNGDVLKATISGSTITVYKNGTQVLQGTDSTFRTGSPGMGFYLSGGSVAMNADYGFSSFSADDGTVTPPPSPLPIATLSANPASIQIGSSSTLSWATTNAASVSIDNGIGSVALAGSLLISPAQSTTYTLTATGAGGTSAASVTVTVTAAPPPPQPSPSPSPSPSPVPNRFQCGWWNRFRCRWP
jgi:hypothetical protein